ncbi:hypothetical protein LWI29_028762 [Acer saccharum]|uniref:Uncharacterized protein n=1 Tax=Acer saccharum TaxID=4024 RepID=A0AA39VVW3_ACESA|nr:hypothetical protein LWI29_028762 [Acer saccharum]
MASIIPSRLLVLAFSLLLLLPSFSLAHQRRPHHFRGKRDKITYHGGGLLTGNINLVLIWYGNFDQPTKDTVKSFIDSFNFDYKGYHHSQPTVAKWWNLVENYQSAAWPRGVRKKSKVKVIREVSEQCYWGKILTMDFIPKLVQKAVGGTPNTVAVLFTAKDVAVHGLCTGKCQLHGMLKKKQPYIVVGNSEIECPGSCMWPFHSSEYFPRGGVVLKSPNGNAVGDSMVVHLASGLAELVTNPGNTGFYGGTKYKPIEITGGRCRNVFGKRASAKKGRPGILRYAYGGKAFNAYGKYGKKFLLPALYNPKTKGCTSL